MSDFSAPYHALSPAGRVLAQAFGVIYPHALTVLQMAQALKRFRIAHAGQLIHIQDYKGASQDLVDAGIALDTGYHRRFSAARHWAPWLTVEAHREKRLGRIKRAYLDAHPPSWGRRDYGAVAQMKLRCDVVAGRFDRIDVLVADVEDNDPWRWLAHPGVGHLLAQVPERHVDDAFAAALREIARTADLPDPILEAYDQSAVDSAEHAAAVAFIRVLQGDHAAALEVFEELPEELRAQKPAITGLASTRALLATLRGDDAEAARHIDEALAAERIGTRKRNLFPDCDAFALALLSLARNHTPANAATLDHLIRVGGKLGRDRTLLGGLKTAVDIRNGVKPYWFARDCPPALPRLFDGFEACWANDFPADDPDGRFTALQHFGAHAWINGYKWLSIECLEAFSRWWRACGNDERRMARKLGLGDEPDALANFISSFHEEMGTTTLASLLAPIPEWEYSLRGIEQIAYEASRKKPKRKKAAARQEKRLAWVIEVDDYGDVTATPKEQSQYKNGGWSKGRTVSLQRLKSHAGTMAFLIDQDRAAARSIVKNPNRWSDLPNYYMTSDGIWALAGHPFVFNGEGDSVEIAPREPELTVTEKDGRVRASVHPHVDEARGRTHHIVWASDTRFEVTKFTAEHKKLCDAIPPKGVELPGEAKERLVEAVSALSREIRVQGAVEEASRVARQAKADPRPWVRLEPSGPGLSVALLVEPVPESGIHFQAGVGGATAFATVEGEAVQVQRDLRAELEALRELLRACPMLAAAGLDDTFTLAEPAECLALVDQLEAAGVRCLWPKGQPFKMVARADASSLRLSVKTAADWFTASGSLDLDEGSSLDLRRLFDLIDKSPSPRFVPLGDGAFVSLSAAFQRQLADLRSVSAPRGKKQLRLHGLAALTLRDFMDDAQLDHDEGWRAKLRSFREAAAFEPVVPGTLQAELRPYQEDGFAWLARLSRWGAGACLADDMGLGKTVQTLAALLDRAQDGPALVVAPTSVVQNWLDEARRFAPTLNVRSYTGLASSRAAKLDELGPFDLVVTTYGLLHNDVAALAAVEWSTAVLDEAQAIKNPATKRARAARKLRARFRIVTTGTPIQNNVVDLYSLFAFLNPGMLGSQQRFRQHFALPIERDRDPEARTRLRRLIAPFVLRRVKSDVLDDLPPRTDVTLHVEMSPEEAALYEGLRLRAMEDLEALAREGAAEPSGQRRLEVLAHLTRLRLACCNPRLVHPDGPPSSKLRTFAETLDELRQGRHKVLVFSQFVRHLELVREHMREAGIPYQYLDGSTPPKARAERIAAFQAGEGDAFLISLKAGGVGLNLTAADYVIHMDPWWNPAAEDQASDRAHRIGQTRPVTVYRLVTRGTIEEQIVELHRHKRELADRLLEGADAPARLSTEELLALLRG